MSSPSTVPENVRLNYLTDPMFWRRLMRRLMTDLREMERADRALLARRPEPVPFDFGAVSYAQEARTAELKAAVKSAKAMPDGWFAWTSTSKRKAAAVQAAKHDLRVWRHIGRDRFVRSEFARAESRNRRISRKTASFDARPDVMAARARAGAMAGVIAEAEGAGPDEALFAALAPVVTDSGKIVRIHVGPAFDLLRSRAALLAAKVPEDEAPEPAGPGVVDVADMEKAGDDDRPSLDDIYDSLDALG